MEKQDNYSAAAAMAPSLAELEYSIMIPPSSASPPNTFNSTSISTSAQISIHHHQHDAALVDPVYMLEFPFINAHHHHHHHHHNNNKSNDIDDGEYANYFPDQERNIEFLGESASLRNMMEMDNATANATCSDPVMNHNNNSYGKGKKNRSGKRKRARTAKTSEESENQRMTHIEVERNRRKQMNEHLRVLRSLMPTSYVQRGDQASIVGGAIDFVRELQQLLECLESQKRRRIYGEEVVLTLPNNQPFDPNNTQVTDGGDDAANLDSLMMNVAENKSGIADVEVKLLGFDALIKISTRRRPGQLIKAISALQDLEFTVLHANVTTIEQTALYSFNVRIGSETRFRADDIASSVQQIFTFIPANSAI